MCLIIDDLILLFIAVEQDNTNLQHAFVHSRYQKWFLRQLRQNTEDGNVGYLDMLNCLLSKVRGSEFYNQEMIKH